MTRTKIIQHLENTPIMASAMADSIEKLEQTRRMIELEDQHKRNAARRSYFQLFLITIIGCTFGNILIDTTVALFIITQVVGQILCAIYWYITVGNIYRKSVILKNYMFTVIDTAIHLKTIAKE